MAMKGTKESAHLHPTSSVNFQTGRRPLGSPLHFPTVQPLAILASCLCLATREVLPGAITGSAGNRLLSWILHTTAMALKWNAQS